VVVAAAAMVMVGVVVGRWGAGKLETRSAPMLLVGVTELGRRSGSFQPPVSPLSIDLAAADGGSDVEDDDDDDMDDDDDDNIDVAAVDAVEAEMEGGGGPSRASRPPDEGLCCSSIMISIFMIAITSWPTSSAVSVVACEKSSLRIKK
jgi:hypothetical protein